MRQINIKVYPMLGRSGTTDLAEKLGAVILSFLITEEISIKKKIKITVRL